MPRRRGRGWSAVESGVGHCARVLACRVGLGPVRLWLAARLIRPCRKFEIKMKYIELAWDRQSSMQHMD